MEIDKQEDETCENGDFEEDEGNHVDIIKDASSVKNVDLPVVLSDNGDSDVVESIGNSNSPVVVNSDDASRSDDNSSEAMEIGSKDDEDDDSNVVELGSNVSVATSDVVEVDRNASNNPSLISEDSSRDSVDSVESVKSVLSSNSKQSDTLVGTVKDDDGDDILITLNEEEDIKEKITGQNEKTEIKSIEDVKEETEKDETEKSLNKIENQKVEGGKGDVAKILKNGPVSTIAPVTSQAVPTVAVSSITPGTSLLLSSAPIPVLSPQQNMVPAGYQLVPQGNLVQQGNQFGYISVVGNQHIFIPATSTLQAANNAKNPMIAKQLLTAQQQQQQKQNVKKITTTTKPEDLRPKSSWEMVELMKWEIQNRIPDNYNWSVAFHGRKEELSTVTAFLQELGSDVVKEQVYKDIIQIQTKKKVAGDLKDAEVESLEKMKTVYENTKKKVEHLQLQTKVCEKCRFKTESRVIMDYHNDFPHYDPPWDLNKGWLMCAQSDCDFKTKTVAHFIFHQKDIHNVQAKFIEKDQYFQCPLCPLNASTKNKLEKHQQKCMKNFKLNANLQPYYHDVNFSMKTCFYKPKKIITKPPPPPPKPLVKPTTTMLTRQHGTAPVQPVSQANQPIKPHTNVAIRQRLPLIRNPMTQQNVQRSMLQQQRPMPALHRAPLLPQRPTVPQQRLPGQPQKAVRPPGREMAGFEVCELCGGYVKDRQALRIHFYYAHKVEMPQAIFNRPNPPLTCEVCKSHYWTTQGLAKHKSAQRHFVGATKPTPGLSGKIASEQECFMCMKLFPNLFVHFEKIHGMTMKDLVLVRKCIMCGLAASDYRSLETHLVNAHGVLIRVNDYINDRNKVVKPSTAIIGGGKNVGKINYCVFCQIQFPDNIQLTMHCIKVHATCDTCGMVVATSKHLSMGHSCRKAHINRSCYICGTMVISQEKYAIHLRSHVKPCRVKLQNLNEEEIEAVKNKLKREYKPAVISLDSDEDSDVEVVETKPSKTKNMLEKEDGKDVEMVDLSKESDQMQETTEKPKENNTQEEKDKNIASDHKEKDVEEDHDLQNEFQAKSKQTDDGVEADKHELKQDVSENSNNIKKDGNETGYESSGNSKDEISAELSVKMDDEKMIEKNGRETEKEMREMTLGETICTKNDSDEVSESEKGNEGKENVDEMGQEMKETFQGTEDASECEKNIMVEEISHENEIKKEDTKMVEETINKEQISLESSGNDVKSEKIHIKSDFADNENVDLSRNVEENIIDTVDERKAEYADDENEHDIEKLLDEDKESVVSFGNRKRKKSESDIDEDELLRDDSNTKRLKVDNGCISVTDQTDSKLAQGIALNESVQDVEMGDNPSNDEQIETKEDI